MTARRSLVGLTLLTAAMLTTMTLVTASARKHDNNITSSIEVRKSDLVPVDSNAPEVERRIVRPGITLTVGPKANDTDKALLAPFISEMSRFEFQPPARSHHFQWMNEHNAELICWRGEIQDYRRGEDGLFIRIKVWPDVIVPGSRVAHLDFVFEDYFYGVNRLTYVGHEDPETQKVFVQF